MKKFLLLVVFVISTVGLFSQTTTQNEAALYLRGGYSLFTGVVGGELQIDNFSVGGGWMPNSTPISGESVNSYGISASIYSDPYYENSYYFTFGYIINGYIEEYSSGYYSDYSTSNVFGLLGGYKWSSEWVDLKVGAGFGFGEGITAFTAEITLGVNLLSFRNL